MKLIPIPLLCAALLLSACAAPGPVTRAERHEGRSEKAILAVLRAVDADDAQRKTILAAYDRHNPVLTQAAADWQRIAQEWVALDRRAADFTSRSEALAAQRQQIAARQFTESAAFEREVAAALTETQWRDWQELWDLVATPETACAPDAPPGRRR